MNAALSARLLPAIMILVAMIAASALATSLVPSKRLSDEWPIGNLNKTIPEQFGHWKLDQASSAYIVDPTMRESLWGIYSQTVSRTYVHSSGYRLMLSIAYGGDQSRALQVHRPEVCYAAGGFRILMRDKTEIRIMDSLIPAMHLIAQQDNRLEPITYWVRIGKTLVRGNVEQGLARLHYRFNGYIADGLLFRVSSIDSAPSRAFEMQDQFVADLKAALPEERRWTIFGDM